MSHVISLAECLPYRDSDQFGECVKRALEAVPVEALPLHQGLTHSTSVSDAPRTVMIIRITEHPALIEIRAGVFYSGLHAGCSCADDPTPIEPVPEYVELDIELDHATGRATVRLVDQEAD